MVCTNVREWPALRPFSQFNKKPATVTWWIRLSQSSEIGAHTIINHK